MSVVGVHGFTYDPESKRHNATSLFKDWATMLGQQVDGFDYYSYPVGLDLESFAAYWRSFKRGYWNKYVCAFKEAAPEAASNFTYALHTRFGKSNIIAHSLGSRVINLAMPMIRLGYMKRILILEGAELQINVVKELPPGVEVLNIHSRSDRVLEDFGSVFNCEALNGCIGRDGLGRKMDKWYDICLDDPATQARVKKARGWELDGTPERISLDPFIDIRDFGGHWRAYNDPDNAPLYRAWFAGDSLSDIL